MIKKWNLTNFKSVLKKTELKFEPLTIFAGANSSGKSTIIQSILLATQTVQNNVTSRSVVLNGHISKFGSYKNSRTRSILLECVVKVPSKSGNSPSPNLVTKSDPFRGILGILSSLIIHESKNFN